jgi:lipoprotein signal peptidase
VLTTFIIATLDSLQEDYSQVTANALYHISQQLHDPTVAFLPDLPKFHPQRSDVRVNILWLVSLVISLLAALLSILVKQWLAEYMTWTSMVPSKNTVALRQYRAQGWDRWGVRRYREAIPVLLQLALVLFLCGLLDFLWNLQQTVAIAITTVAGTSLGVWIFVTLMPTVIAQCPYRSPLSWFSRRVMQAIGDLWSIFLTAPFIIGSLTGILIRFLAGLRTGTQAETMLKTVFRRTYSLLDNVFIALGVYGRVSWDFWDLRRMDDPAVVNSLAMAATGEVVIQFPSADVLSTMSAGAYKIDGETGTMWLPIDGLWSLLRGLIGDDPLTRAMVFIKLRISFTDELCAPGFSSKDFCHSVVRLVRCAIRTQRGCSPREISNARYVIDVSHIIAESEQSILPYHTTTLVWLLHRDVPDALVHVAERHLRSLSGAAWITNAAKWRWDVSGAYAQRCVARQR